jgi:tetratricopeptide (TPR) repeat protein
MRNILFTLALLVSFSSCRQTSFEYFESGYAKGNLEDYSGAIADYSKAIELDPDYAATYNNRGVAKYSAGLDGCSDLMKAKSLGYNVHPGAMKAICN